MQPNRPVRTPHIHNLRGNKAERSPHRLFIWDTETLPRQEVNREVHALRLWASETVQRHNRRPSQPAIRPQEGLTAPDLVDALVGACRSSETVWGFAHNQSFDLAVTRLPLLLLRRGWVITSHALTSSSPWARLQKGSHRLTLVDSTSWLPGALQAIGSQVSLEKPPLPADDAEVGDWWVRCRTDVAILRTAICELMDWWDRRKLGYWSITGPQTGFNALRHMPTPHKVVIDPNPAARAFEREAVMGGRREVWRVGKLPFGDYREIDFHLAHATIAAHCPLPKRRSVWFEEMRLDDWRLTSDRWSPMAWATVNARTPRYPLQVGGRLFYPVGRFRTLLCGPELREAYRREELLSVGPGYVYQLGQHMGDWGRWVLSELGSPREDTPEVGRTAIKGWSRSVPGKWAARTGRLIHQGLALEQGWGLEHGRHHPGGAPVSVLDMAGSREVILQDQDADDCFPAVLAWIQSEVRLRLGLLIDRIGPEHMVSCNTDGVICTGTGRWRLGATFGPVAPLVPREKARYSTLEVISPQHLVLDQERRLSGVPASAEEVGDHQYSWMTWPRMATQIGEGSREGYVRMRRSADLSGVPVNRWVDITGRCWPVKAELGEDGVSRLGLPWWGLFGSQQYGLRAVQHPALQGLLDAQEEAEEVV